MALDASGDILLVGSDNWASGNPLPAVVRFTATGLPDPNFGTNGEVLLNPPSLNNPWAFDVGVQSTGQIVVCGNFPAGKGAVCRLNTNGTLDTTFGTGGYFIPPTGNALALTVQPDDKILVAGGTPSPSGGTNSFEVDRVLPDGSSLDSAFGSGGRATTTFANSMNTAAFAIALGPDGKITTTGPVLGSPEEYGIARFLNDITTNTASLATGSTTSLAAPATMVALPPELVAASLDSPDITTGLGPKKNQVAG
jgi:uncharacterized delta-60 repeat protein